ncbi:MAG: LEA type 2 family protein, partial [Candidatus Thermoplasmatota archaeon]|nr:LEA type 2 family protein [Candidatus Thermoplasmatota archaeon]
LVIILLLLPIFLYEGYLLQQTAQQIQVEDAYVEEYNAVTENGYGNVTKIEMELKIEIKNPTATSVRIERLDYELMIEPNNVTREDIEFDSGQIYDQTIHGGGVTTISIPIENEDEDNIEKIQDYILEVEGEVEATVEVHVPLLQIYVDLPVTTVSRQLKESFEYKPILAGYEVDEEDASLERAEEEDEADHILKIPYEIETNDNEFLSGEVDINTTMESVDGNITSSDSNRFEIGESKQGNFSFGLDKNDTEELLTEYQTIEFYSDIGFEEDISFQRDHPSIESPAMLEDFEVDEDNATLEEAEEGEDSDYVLKTPYEIKTNDNEFISGEVDIHTTMTDHDTITSSDDIKFEIGEDKEGNLTFGLDEDDIEELLTETQDIEFSSDISYEDEDISFEREHESVHSQAMLVEYELKGDEAELDVDNKTMEIPYYIETNETAFFEEGGNISINTTMESEDGTITSSAAFNITIGETEEGNLTFGLDEEELTELSEEDKTLQFTSDVERNDISFEYDHDEEVYWEAPLS